MKIKDCAKGYNRGISKVFSPERTFRSVLRKIKSMDPPILKSYFEVLRPGKIPQYAFIGTESYRRLVKKIMLVPKTAGSNGKGHFKEQAKASGLMELVERYSCCKYIVENKHVVRICSFRDLKSKAFQLEDLYADFVYDAYRDILEDEGLKAAKIRWYEGYSLNGSKVYLPMSLIILLLEGTNGMASGNSLEEALLHAVCEVIERHCLSLIELSKSVTPDIDISTIDSPIANKIIKKLQSPKYRIYIKDFSLGIGVPVIGVVRQVDNTNYIITAGVATTREEALIRALTENSQGEGRENYRERDRIKNYLAGDKTIRFEEILNVDDNNMKVELENIANILEQRNMKIFYINTTDKSLNIPSVIVYISGAKTIYYHECINSRNVIMLLMKEFFDTENYRDFMRYLQKAVTNNYVDKSGDDYFRGIIFKRRSQYKKAIDCLSRVVKTDVTEPCGSEKADIRIYSFINMGLCYQAINDMGAAADCYLKAIDLSQDSRIEDLQPSYDNIRSLSKSMDLFKNGCHLYQNIRALRIRFPKVSAEEFKTIFLRIPERRRKGPVGVA